MEYSRPSDGRRPKQGEGLIHAYFIADLEGNILTSVENAQHLEWTMQALMEEENKRAVLYKNPYHIPKRIAAEIPDHYSVYKIDVPAGQAFAVYEETIEAGFAGPFGQFQPKLPGIEARKNTDYMQRAVSKKV